MKIQEIFNIASNWTSEKQLIFIESILNDLFMGIRSIYSYESINAKDKLDAIYWLNEFQHRIQNILKDYKSMNSPVNISGLFENAIFYAKQNKFSAQEIGAVIKLSFESISVNDNKNYISNFSKSIFELLLDNNFRKRTPMFIGDNKISSLEAFINGYLMATDYHKLKIQDTDPQFIKFNDWISQYFKRKESTSGWKNMILLETDNSEEKALERFFKLYDEFKQQK